MNTSNEYQRFCLAVARHVQTAHVADGVTTMALLGGQSVAQLLEDAYEHGVGPEEIAQDAARTRAKLH